MNETTQVDIAKPRKFAVGLHARVIMTRPATRKTTAGGQC